MFYDVFYGLCRERGMSPSKALETMGFSKSSVTKWRDGTIPNDSTKRRLAEFFDVDLSVFTGEQAADSFRIPVLGTVPAGIPLEAIEDVVDWEEIPKAMLNGGKEYFALKVKGDSMWPRFLEGDTVIVRKSPTCRSGEICVVYVNGYDATLKEVRMNEADKSLSLIPENKNYPPRTYTRKEVEELPVTIAGVVVELRRKI